jgi:hypothetical protein
LTDYAALLDVYTLEEILELNDMTTEELLIYLVEEKIISLPEIQPIEFDD